MAASLSLLQLLILGTLILPAHTQEGDPTCDLLLNATASNFSVSVEPDKYQANTNYTVKIKDEYESVTSYVLQALNPQNKSIGEWKDVETDNCSSIEIAVLNTTQKEANWTSPGQDSPYVEIRAYIILSDGSAVFNITNLTTASPTTTSAPTTSPNSVCMVQSSSFLLAALQLPLLLATSRLLS